MERQTFEEFRESMRSPESFRTKDHFFYNCPNTVALIKEIEKVIHDQFVLASESPEKQYFGKSFVKKLNHEFDEREKLFIKTEIFNDWGRKVIFFKHFYWVSKVIW